MRVRRIENGPINARRDRVNRWGGISSWSDEIEEEEDSSIPISCLGRESSISGRNGEDEDIELREEWNTKEKDRRDKEDS